MNAKSAKEAIELLQNRIMELINKSGRNDTKDIREWCFHCKSTITELKYRLNKLEDYLLYNNAPLDKDFKHLEALRFEGIDVIYIKNTIENVAQKISSLELQYIEKIGNSPEY